MATKVTSKTPSEDLGDNVVKLPGIGHNVSEPLDEAAMRAKIVSDRQTRFLGKIAQLQDQNELILSANNTVKELRSTRKAITAGITALGYSMEDTERALKDAEGTDENLEQREKMRIEMRAALGVQTVQFDLFKANGVADGAAIDQEVRAQTAGYQAAILRKPANVPEQFMGANQAWLRGWHEGQSRSLAARAEAERLEAEEAAQIAMQQAEAARRDTVGAAYEVSDDEPLPFEVGADRELEEPLELACGQEDDPL